MIEGRTADYSDQTMLRSTLLTVALLLASCHTPARQASTATDAGPKPDARLGVMAFMTGTWVQEQANGAIIEEQWSMPRGASMLGAFRRLLGNGATPFYEFTQIVAEQDRVVLRQIHVHGNFETDPRRAVPMELVLEKAAAGSATFVPVPDGTKANAGSLDRVTYQADGPDTLVVTVQPKAAEGKPAESPLVFRMSRVR
ncbi:MAG: hypothetical protein RL461_206 [Planctomycetota bacterium]